MSKQKPKLNQNTIHRVLKLIRPYTGMVILTLTFALITVVTTLLAPVLSTVCKHRVSGSLSLPSRGPFHLSFTVLCSIGH